MTEHTSSLTGLLEAHERDPYNSIHVFKLESGGLAVTLSHKISEDDAVTVRIESDKDVMFHNDPVKAAKFDRLNKTGWWHS